MLGQASSGVFALGETDEPVLPPPVPGLAAFAVLAGAEADVAWAKAAATALFQPLPTAIAVFTVAPAATASVWIESVVEGDINANVHS